MRSVASIFWGELTLTYVAITSLSFVEGSARIGLRFLVFLSSIVCLWWNISISDTEFKGHGLIACFKGEPIQ